ncbi:MAG: ferritin family protein [Planctomycetota bacterium]|nr:ferritin family protein [Planctomycetota bacterium]
MSQMFFNEIEAVRIAQNMEKNGLAFYQRAAAKTGDAKVRAIFQKLIEDEKNHLKTFEELETTLVARRTADAEPEDDKQLGAYIDRLLQTQVFCEKCAAPGMLDKAHDDCSALSVSLQAERDAIVFYLEMLGFVDSKEAKEAFEWILKEERQHLVTIGERGTACGFKI